MRLDLVLLNSEKLQFHFDQDSIVFGRSSKCDVVITHESMSRQHCRIDYKNGEFFITDLGSSNGVYIDERKIPANEPTPFQTYFNISFGYVSSCHITLEDPSETLKADPFISEPLAKGSAKTRPSKPPEKKSEIAASTSRSKSYAVNILAFLGILGAIYYYMTHEKPAANTLETKKSNSEITESDLF